MYQQTTENIRISVSPTYLDDQSEPDRHQYVFAYHVVIENLGDETVRLMNRYWKITDALGRVQEVRGAGVVGEQPELKSGERFDYTSGAPIPTASGFMAGHYEMITDSGRKFDAAIPAFSLDAADRPTVVN